MLLGIRVGERLDFLSLHNHPYTIKVENYVKEKQEENHQLEFKTIDYTGLDHRDDRKNLAIGLSGFANSAGGIIIWGINADNDNSDKIDRASEKKPVSQLSLFTSKLNEHTGTAISPVLSGITHRSFLFLKMTTKVMQLHWYPKVILRLIWLN